MAAAVAGAEALVEVPEVAGVLLEGEDMLGVARAAQTLAKTEEEGRGRHGPGREAAGVGAAKLGRARDRKRLLQTLSLRRFNAEKSMALSRSPIYFRRSTGGGGGARLRIKRGRRLRRGGSSEWCTIRPC